MAVAQAERLERISPRRADKFSERRLELAEAALTTLAELGYARTSLREIAQNSAFTHGVLHYYFTDKIDLITCCVRLYKARCVTRYDAAIAGSKDAAALLEGFLEVFGATLQEDATLHRLWYDLRAQALYEPQFQADVAAIDQTLEDMIWRVMARFGSLTGITVPLSRAVAYAVFDGLFQRGLLKHLSGDPGAIPEMLDHARAVLTPTFLAGR